MPKETFFNLPEDKQEKVMRAAVGEFLEHGFEKGNIGEIAKNAGVAKGSMYQYFENKKELFSYSVRWCTELLIKKNDQFTTAAFDRNRKQTIFDFFYESAMRTWLQLKEEKEAVLFLEDVFTGKFGSVKDESMNTMLKVSESFILRLIRDGKTSGCIRNDINDHILSLFLTGASWKFKEYLINKVRASGDDLAVVGIEAYESEIKGIIELIINGMGEK